MNEQNDFYELKEKFERLIEKEFEKVNNDKKLSIDIKEKLKTIIREKRITKKKPKKNYIFF
ncbi:MAG: hypothetical protein ACFFAS_05900 [Promethearchaeota archaeon]